MGQRKEDPPRPRRIELPFLQEEIGLGDVIKKITSAVGIKPCNKCNQRAELLNQQLVFSSKDCKGCDNK